MQLHVALSYLQLDNYSVCWSAASASLTSPKFVALDTNLQLVLSGLTLHFTTVCQIALRRTMQTVRVALFFFFKHLPKLTVGKVHTDMAFSSNFKFYIWLLGQHGNAEKPQSSQQQRQSCGERENVHNSLLKWILFCLLFLAFDS